MATDTTRQEGRDGPVTVSFAEGGPPLGVLLVRYFLALRQEAQDGGGATDG